MNRQYRVKGSLVELQFNFCRVSKQVGTMYYIVLLSISCVLCYSICGVRPLEISKQRALNLSVELDRRFEEATSFTLLQQEYSDIVTGGEVKMLNGTEIVENISRVLSEDFAVLTSALKETVKQVELVYLNHINTSCCSPECILLDEMDFDPEECNKACPNATEYYRAQVPVENETVVNLDLELEYSRVFGSAVNLSSSAIHVPVNIYDQDPLVQCFVEWSDNLTPIFQRNQANFTQQLTQRVTFQYFGSDTGLVRIYPATDWSNTNPCHRCPLPPEDTFTVRRRPWYRNTVSGSKFVIILFDMSGSMTGFRFLLAKLTVQQLLKSLTQDDYFYIIRVADGNKTAPLGCFDGAARATPENVLVMNEVIHSLDSSETGGRADFTQAVKMASKVFSISTECHNTLVVMTDNDADSAMLEGALNVYNTEMEIRVFPIVVGRSGSTIVNNRRGLMRVACDYGGRLYVVEDYNQIFPAVRMLFDDLRKLSLPLDEDSTGKEVFWNLYKELRGNLVLTGSSPLFSHKNDNQTEFVGVVGIDVNLNSTAELFQRWNLGELAYGFMVDSNGQLLVHPQIDKEYIVSLPPDGLLNLDVSHFEDGIVNGTNEFESVRQAMLNRERGQQTIEKWVPLQRGKHYRLKNVTYFYSPVEDTSYSIAIVFPSEKLQIYDYSNQVLHAEIKNAVEPRLVLKVLLRLDDRPYCSGVSGVDPSIDAKTFIEEELHSNIVNDASSANCNPTLVDPLLVDLNVSISLKKTFRSSNHSDRRDPDTSLNVFFQYVSGLTYCLCEDDDKLVCVCPNQTQPFIDLAMEDTTNNSLLFYSIDSTLFIIKKLVVNDNSSTGLVGTALPDDSKLMDSLIARVELTEEADVTASYVIDSSGYIVISSREDNLIGRRFAAVEPAVFADMLDVGVYLTEVMRGYELRPCNLTLTMNTTGCLGSSAYSVYQGLVLSLMKWMVWALNGGIWLTFKLLMLNILGSLQSFTGWNFKAAAATPEHPDTSCPAKLCLEEVLLYQLNSQFEVSEQRHVNCSNTDTEEDVWYEAVRVNGTNLVLVIVSDNCSLNSTTERGYQESPIPCVCNCDRRSGSLEECDVYRRPMDNFCNGNNTMQLCSSSHSSRTTSCFLFSVIVSLSVLTRIL